MSNKILNLQCDILVLTGIILALRVIYTKDIYMHVGGGYTVNILVSLILLCLLDYTDKWIRKLSKRQNHVVKSSMHPFAYFDIPESSALLK